MRSTLLLIVLLVSFECAAQEMQHIGWVDLVPKSDRQKQMMDRYREVNHSGNDIGEQPNYGFVRPILNGAIIQISGFIVEIEPESTGKQEYFLVPYVGACIHVPPPPMNQIIRLVFNTVLPQVDTWEYVSLEGTLTTDMFATESMTVGYQLMASHFEKIKSPL